MKYPVVRYRCPRCGRFVFADLGCYYCGIDGRRDPSAEAI